MGRYRQKEPRGSPYITSEGYACLAREQQDLWRTRKEVTEAVTAAAAEGDRSENAEYIYRKKQLREIDRRLRYLGHRLDELHVVCDLPSDTSRIFFGAWVRLEDSEGKELVYRIVGPDEFDIAAGHISMDSPVARALLKQGVDDEVVVSLADGERRYIVLEVSYKPLRRDPG